MNTIAQWLTEDGNIVVPKTLDTQVFDENGKSLNRRLKTAKDEQIIQLPKVNPTLIVSDLNYSTEEQLTGKRWIDGKPIYQKSFEFETGDGTQSRIIYEDKNSFLVDINSNMNNVTEAPYFKYIETDNADGIRISFHQSNQYSNKKYNVTILYTKTTDTASSPVAPPKVEALHVYSTEEKVVGTWIDGKPLYEKTVYFGSGTLSNRASVSFENMNIDKIMVISGTFEDTTEGQLSIPVSLDGTFYVGFYCSRRRILLTFNSEFNGRISNAYAVIQYTKTTDTAATT